MVIHFICRGNAFRSIIAEAYLKSLAVPGIEVLSSGTVAEQYRQIDANYFHKTSALLERHHLGQYTKARYGDQLSPKRLQGTDLAICMNSVVYEESKPIVTLPEHTLVWDITDIGERGRIATSDDEWWPLAEETFDTIVKAIDTLVKGGFYGSAR